MRVFDLASVSEALRRGSEAATAAEDAAGPRAAVAAVLRHGPEEAEILLIRRAEREGDPWSGHMAFPGGRRDRTDATLLDTAIREAQEEVGIHLERDARLLRRLPDLPAFARSQRADLTITPFVFAAADIGELRPNAEVAEALWTPLGPLVRGEGAGTFEYTHESGVWTFPCLDVNGHRVWGLTYRMLELLRQALDT